MKVVEMDNIIAALVSGLAAVLAVIITGIFNSRKLSNEFKASSRESDLKIEAKLEKYEAVTNKTIEELTREVRAHNNFAQKIPALEEKISNLEKFYYKGG